MYYAIVPSQNYAISSIKYNLKFINLYYVEFYERNYIYIHLLTKCNFP